MVCIQWLKFSLVVGSISLSTFISVSGSVACLLCYKPCYKSLSNKLNIKSFVRLCIYISIYLVSLFRYVHWHYRYNFDHDLRPFLCGWDWFDKKRYMVWNTPYLFSSHVCHWRFSKHSGCFGGILVVKIWQPTMSLKTHMLIDKLQLLYHMLLFPAFF